MKKMKSKKCVCTKKTVSNTRLVSFYNYPFVCTHCHLISYLRSDGVCLITMYKAIFPEVEHRRIPRLYAWLAASKSAMTGHMLHRTEKYGRDVTNFINNQYCGVPPF